MDLHVFDPRTMRWRDLTGLVTGGKPSPRDSVGFTSANGKLYLYGGNFQLSTCLVFDSLCTFMSPDSVSFCNPLDSASMVQ